MAERPSLRAKLANVLLTLPVSTRTVLVRHIDKARMAGQPDPTYDLILDAAQMAFRLAGQPAPRLHSPMRRLFVPVEPFLVDVASPVKQAGRIARSSLNPIWAWLERDLLAEDLPPLVEAIKAAVFADDETRADELGDRLLHLVDGALTKLPDLVAEPAARRRMAAQIGSERILHDLLDVGRILPLREELARLSARLPENIGAYDPESVAEHLAALETFARGHPERMTYGLALLQGQLADPSKIVLHALAGTRSDEPARVLEGRYAPAVGLALGALEEALVRLRRAMAEDLAEAPAALRAYHGMARSLTAHLDTASVAEWRQRLATLRREASDLVAPAMAEAPALTRRVIHPTGGRNGQGVAFDALEAERAVAVSALVDAARSCAGSLALNALLAELKTTFEPSLEAAIGALVQAIRLSHGPERKAILARAAPAVEIARAVLGERYGEGLQRSIASAQSTQKAGQGAGG